MNYASDGFKSLPSGDPTGFNKADYLGKLQWKSKADAPVQHDILLKAGLAEEESNETYLGLTQSDFESNPFARYAGSNEDLMATEQSQLTLTHRISLPKGWNVTTTAYRTDFHRNWYKLDKVRTDSGAVGISAILDAPDRYGTEYAILTGINTTGDEALLLKANNRTYYAQGVQSKIEYRLHGEETEHHFEVGARIHEDQIDRFQWVDEYDMDNGIMELAESGTPGTESNRIETATAFAGYVNYKLSAGRTSLHPGARLENVSVHRRDFGKEDPDRTGSSLSERTNRVIAIMPGIAVNHELSTHTSLFMGVHKGFAPPGSKEGTDPESSVNYELGTRIHHSRLSSEAVVFFSDYANLLGVDLAASGGTGSTSLFNGGAAQAYGLEFQLTYQLLKPSSRGATMPLTVVYTFSDAYFENSFNSEFEGWGSVEAGDHLPYMAPHQFTIITSYERDDYSFSISGKYASEMRTVPGQESPVRSQSTDAFFTVDAAVDIRISSGISFFASGTNLTDEVYVVARRPAGARPGMPRSIRLGIKARF
jgi:Fe(3+) dicitrate transport protein